MYNNFYKDFLSRDNYNNNPKDIEFDLFSEESKIKKINRPSKT